MTVESFTDASSTVFNFERQHHRNEGKIPLPVYGPAGTSCRMVRLHAPIESLTVVWAATKEGAPPTVPHPTLFDTNLVFIRGRRSAACPMPLAGSLEHSWAMAGVYEYAQLVPTGLDSAMPTGKVPWDNVEVDDTIIPADVFSQLILEKEEG